MRETSLDDFIGGADENDESEPEAQDEVEESKIHEPDADESLADEPKSDELGDDASVIDESVEHEVDESETDPNPDPDPDPDSDPVEPAVSTYDWTPTGADCQACGTTVETRWRDEGRLVCADCKVW